MANTFTQIAKTALTNTTNNVVFSNIPQTYYNLVVRAVVRTDNASTLDYCSIKINNNTSSIYSGTILYSNDGSSANGSQGNNTTFDQGNIVPRANGANAVANQFGVAEWTFTNYISSAYNKGFLINGATENNITATFNGLWNNSFNSTSPITQLEFVAYAGTGFVSGSTFYLYGLANS